MRLKDIGLFLVLIFSLAADGFGQEDWSLKKDQDGIKVYTRSVEGTSFKAFKGSIVLDVDQDKLIARLTDMSGFSSWMPNVSELEVVNAQTYYVLTDSPWPAADRDGYYEMTIDDAGMPKEYLIRIAAKPDLGPEKKKTVRITKSNVVWRIEALDAGGYLVEYEVEAEPGGGVPGWLANSSVVSIPYDTLSSLRDSF